MQLKSSIILICLYKKRKMPNYYSITFKYKIKKLINSKQNSLYKTEKVLFSPAVLLDRAKALSCSVAQKG